MTASFMESYFQPLLVEQFRWTNTETAAEAAQHVTYKNSEDPRSCSSR
jgi:hypothetical protein